MKQTLCYTLCLACLTTALSLRAEPDQAVPGGIDFGKFTAATSSKGEFVEVHIKNNLINMVARLAEKTEPEVAKLLRGLKMIRVNVIGLNDDNRDDVVQRIQAIHGQLDQGQWESMVTVQQKDQDVRVYLKTRGEEAVEGLVVTVLEGKKEAVLVNIIGDIRPEQVAIVGERFNLEPLKKLSEKFPK